MSRIGYEIITSDVESETQNQLRYRPVIKWQPKRRDSQQTQFITQVRQADTCAHLQ